MKLSTKTRYVVRALVDLAVNYNGSPVQIKDIAKRELLSVRYLENLFTVLRAGGILKSEKGHGGGFKLGKKPEDISLLDVVELIEGKVVIVDCLADGSLCEIKSDCITHDVWEEINNAIIDILKKTTIADLMKKYRAKKRKKEG